MASRVKQCDDPKCPCAQHGGHARHLEYSDDFAFEARREAPRSEYRHKGGLSAARRAELSGAHVRVAIATRNLSRVNPPPRGTRE